ncbi:hypothetical protein CDEST_02151 [Colletotrichum destructivum]|uniref:Uncharacterized protein n=1 Tax=Colletotrichum destructivum TaxID=34406 RepID=A0AAX4I1A8_9PEZI|nr:hypothetical protein CDEST_02151 [Colletotrichum destructivum]
MVNKKQQTESDLADRNAFWEVLRSKECNDARLTHRLESSLSDHKRRCVRQIAKHQVFYRAFVNLSGIPGIRAGLVIGNLHRLITLKCDEEVVNYLQHIYDTWLRLAGGVVSNLGKIDSFTVQSLEHRCPRFSAQDERALQNIVLDGLAFRCFNRSERLAIWETLCSFDFTIPSLSTFCSDFKYLELCAKPMKRLISIPYEGHTVQTAFSMAFQQPAKEQTQYPIENSDMNFSYRPLESRACFQLGLRQLWLFAMRNFRNLESNPTFLPKFASLASTLGFDTSKIRSLKSMSPDLEIARQALLLARPPQDYDYDVVDLQPVVKKIANEFPDLHRVGSAQKSFEFFTDDYNLGQNFRPWLNQMSYADATAWLFIDVIDKLPDTRGERITDLFILRSIYLAFFCFSRRNDQQLQLTSSGSTVSDSQSYSLEYTAPQRLDLQESCEEIPTRRERTADAEKSSARKVTLVFITKEMRREEYVFLDTNNPNEPFRFQLLLQEIMANQKVLPVSVGKQPLLVTDCYNEVVERGQDRILLVKLGQTDTDRMI